jgi:xanthine/uracil permease
MDTMQTDWLLVVVAAILNVVIGAIWYSKRLFGPAWLKLCEMKEKEMKGNKKGMLWGFVVSLIIAYFLSFFQGHLGVTSISDGMLVGFLLWLGFVATTQISGVLWCKKPFKLFAINTGYKLLSFLVMSGIIAS